MEENKKQNCSDNYLKRKVKVVFGGKVFIVILIIMVIITGITTPSVQGVSAMAGGVTKQLRLLAGIEDTEGQRESNASSTAREYINNSDIRNDGGVVLDKSVKEWWEILKHDNNDIVKYLDEPKDLAKIINAYKATQYPDTRPSKDDERDTDEEPENGYLEDEIDWKKLNKNVEDRQAQGIVKLKRKLDDENETYLSYVEPEKFDKLIKACNEADSTDSRKNAEKEAMRHFTLEKVIRDVNSSSSSQATAGNIEEGTVIEIPEGLGSLHTYMGWQCITAVSSNQYKLREQAGMNFDDEGFGIINGRYVIACTLTFGQVGDYIDFYQKDGTILHCIIGDIKSQTDEGCTEWGHNNGKCIVEFVVNKDTWYSGGKVSHPNPGEPTCHPEWNCDLEKAINGGSYFDNPDFGADNNIEGKRNQSPSSSSSSSSGSHNVTGEDIIASCDEVINMWMPRNIMYSIDDVGPLVRGDIDKCLNECKYACCATYVACVLYNAGVISAEELNSPSGSYYGNYHYTGSGGLPDLFENLGWEQVDKSEMQAGDVINCYGVHVLIYAGGDTYYDQRTCVISQSGDRRTNGVRTGFSYYLNKYPDMQVWRPSGMVSSKNKENKKKKVEYVAKVAKWSTTTTSLNIEPDDPDGEEYSRTIYNMQSTKVDFRRYIGKYDMPFNYMWAMLIVGEDKEFVLQLADLVYGSTFEIELTDKITTSESSSTEEKERTTLVEVVKKVKDVDTNGKVVFKESKVKEEKKVKYNYTKTITTTSDSLDIERGLVDAWCAKYDPETKKVTEKTSEETEPNFVSVFNKNYNAKSNIFSVEKLQEGIIESWLFEILESNEDTEKLSDLTRYMLYKVTGNEAYGVTSFDDFESWFLQLLDNNVNGGYGTGSIRKPSVSREDFIRLVQSYAPAIAKGIGSQAFRDNAEVIYDVCIKNNINPVICAAEAWAEQNWVAPNTSPFNYWGIAVYPGQNYGSSFSSVEHGVQRWCDIINAAFTDELYIYYAKKYASVDSRFTGNMVNMYDIWAAYASGGGATLEAEAKYAGDYVEVICKCAAQIFGEGSLSPN